jgi:hypothetical protein
MIDKAHILSEIRRTAAENGGLPLGVQRFERETGVKRADWLGRFWARWGDALLDAGFEANKKTAAIEHERLLEKLAAFASELGRLPVYAELRMRAQVDKSFPSHSTWANLGTKTDIARKLAGYCDERQEFQHVSTFYRLELDGDTSDIEPALIEPPSTLGYVYLLKFRSDYKIGASNDPDRRYGEVATQMPEAMIKVHTIKTDDPFGVEKYWHQRFDSRRLKGEWFRLSQADVRAFKKWKTIF